MILLDMEMPKCCDECDFQARVGWCCAICKPIDHDKSFEQRLLDCPLYKIEVPNDINETLESMGEKIKKLRNEIDTMLKIIGEK